MTEASGTYRVRPRRNCDLKSARSNVALTLIMLRAALANLEMAREMGECGSAGDRMDALVIVAKLGTQLQILDRLDEVGNLYAGDNLEDWSQRC